ncbi:MAG TPA: cupin domain-containing protein [Candidatus Hypogeohydataceae bacterium YC40]
MKHITYLILLFIICGCGRGVLDPAIVDELKHPTKFPDIYTPTVLDVDKLTAEYPLEEVEKVKVVPVAETKYSTVQMMVMKQGIEVPTHYHTDHDEVVQVKKGEVLVILDGTRYHVKEGMVIIIPRKVRHKFINTGTGVNVTYSVFFPPHTGEDVKFIKEKKRKLAPAELAPGPGAPGAPY